MLETTIPLAGVARQIIAVDDVRIEAFIGIHGHEKERRQSLIVAIEMEIEPPRGDAIAETVDYNRVVEECRLLADEGIALIETFATRLGQSLMRDSRIVRADVCVTKPGGLANGRARARSRLVRGASVR